MLNSVHWSVRDLRRRPGRYILSVGTIGFAVALVLSSTMVAASMQATLNNQRRLIQYADIQVLLQRPAPESVVGNVSQIPNIEKAEPRIVSFVRLNAPSIGVADNIPVFGVPSPQQLQIDPIILSSGSYFQSADENTAILSPYFYLSGSNFTLATGTSSIQVSVKGVGSSPELNVQNSIAMPLRTVQRILFNQTVINAVYVRLVDPSKARDTAGLLTVALAGFGPDLRFTTRAYFWESYQTFFSQYIFAIGLIGIGLGSAILATSTKLKVDRDEYRVGVLKALGMTRRGLVYLFATDGVLFGASALLVGIPLGYAFLTAVTGLISNAAHTAGYEVVVMDLRTLAIVGVITIVVTVSIVLLSSYNMIKGEPQKALLARYGAGLSSRPGKNLPASFRFTIRYFVGRKARLVSTGLIILLATASVLTMVNTLSAVDQSLTIIGSSLADILVHFPGPTQVNNTLPLLSVVGVSAAEPLALGNVFLTDGFASNMHGVLLNTQVQRITTVLKEGRPVGADNEVVVSTFLANKLGYKLGDQLRFTTGGITNETFALTIVGISYFPFPLTQASYTFVSKMILKAETGYSGDYMLRVTNPSSASVVVKVLTQQLGQYVLVADATDEVKTESSRYILPLSLLNVSIAGAMIGLTASAIFGMTAMGLLDRRKDYAVFKALGAAPRQIFRWTIVETLASSSPFAILGAIAGLALTAYVLGIAETVMLLPFSKWFSLSLVLVAGSLGVEIGVPLLGVLPILRSNALRAAGPELKHE